MQNSTAIEHNRSHQETIQDIVFGLISMGLLIGFALLLLWGGPA